jgi:hypothetical protein
MWCGEDMDGRNKGGHDVESASAQSTKWCIR